jgi:hypothetical protein
MNATVDLSQLSEEPENLLLSPESEHMTPDTPRKNKNYYFEDTMSIFLVSVAINNREPISPDTWATQVGNQLFKVHRHFLRKESDVFNWMFLCPPPAGGTDGGSDDRAIPVPGVTPKEFEALLDFFYTECVARVLNDIFVSSTGIARKFQRHTADMQEWIDLLGISTRFVFQRLRECAIDAIEHHRWRPRPGVPMTIDPIEQIVLAEKHEIPHWFRIAYVSICERSEPLEEWEARKIGFQKATLLARARETVRNPHDRTPTPRPASPVYSIHTELGESETPPLSNGFYHNRTRVDAIVSEVFFPPDPE